MKRKRHTPEEIIKKLRTAEEALASGLAPSSGLQGTSGGKLDLSIA